MTYGKKKMQTFYQIYIYFIRNINKLKVWFKVDIILKHTISIPQILVIILTQTMSRQDIAIIDL